MKSKFSGKKATRKGKLIKVRLSNTGFGKEMLVKIALNFKFFTKTGKEKFPVKIETFQIRTGEPCPSRWFKGNNFTWQKTSPLLGVFSAKTSIQGIVVIATSSDGEVEKITIPFE